VSAEVPGETAADDEDDDDDGGDWCRLGAERDLDLRCVRGI
jgi:hypothetical protein